MPIDQRHYDRATELLYQIWRRIPASYKSQYRRTIWDQFAAQIRVAAFTSDLSKAFNRLCSRFNAHAAFSGDGRTIIAELAAPDADEILRLWREESRTLAVLVQVRNEATRETASIEEEESKNA